MTKIDSTNPIFLRGVNNYPQKMPHVGKME